MTTAPDAPTVVVYDDSDPCPRAEVTVTPGADNARVTVYRVDAAGTHIVRGGWRVLVSGPAVVTDYEPPFGEPVAYHAIGYDAADNPSAVGPDSPPVVLASSGCPWIQDPTDPSTARRFQVVDWEAMEYDRESSVLRPMLSATAIAVVGVRRDPDSEIVLRTVTDSDAAALRSLCAAPVLLLRPDPSWGWPARYWLVGDLEETRQYPKRAEIPKRLWTLPLTAVNAPSPALIRFPYVWRDVVSYFATWADVIDSEPTWLDLLREPTPGAGP